MPSGTDLVHATDSQDEFERWRVCWEANMSFQEPATSSRQICVACGSTTDCPPGSFRSAFFRYTRCRARHPQLGIPVTASADGGPAVAVPGVCPQCDQTFILDVISGQHQCQRAKCRRLLRVDETAVRARLIATMSPVLAPFLSFLAQSRQYECLVHGDLVDCSTESGPLARACHHDRNVCDACIRLDFEAKIKADRLHDLVCPDPDCRQVLSTTRIRELVSTSCRDIYDKKVMLESISKLPNFRWCRCGSGQVHGPGESSPQWICISCDRRHCFICPERDGAVCEHLRALDISKADDPEHQRRVADAASEESRRLTQEATQANWAEILRTTKRCPRRGCGVRIQFKSGCAHMTCRRCRAEFCWSCKVVWPESLAIHLENCPLGTENTKAPRDTLDLANYIYEWDVDEGYDKSLDGELWLQDIHR